MTPGRRLAAEAIGTSALLIAVVGSGIMGERLAQGNDAIALLVNSLATGAALWVLIATLGPISGAHFNPIVTLALSLHGEFPWREAIPYVVVQVVAAFAGVAVAHAMFGIEPWIVSTKLRTGAGQWLSEAVATGGLIGVVFVGGRHRPTWVPGLTAAYIAGAYWFTASTSFANPAVTLARSATDTFAGIRPGDVPGFIVSQLAGAGLALAVSLWLIGQRHDSDS